MQCAVCGKDCVWAGFLMCNVFIVIYWILFVMLVALNLGGAEIIVASCALLLSLLLIIKFTLRLKKYEPQ